MKYPFQPEVLDALPEELAELFRTLEITLLEEICSRLKASDQLNEVTVQDIRALRSHGIDLKEIEKAIRKTTGISETKLNDWEFRMRWMNEDEATAKAALPKMQDMTDEPNTETE